MLGFTRSAAANLALLVVVLSANHLKSSSYAFNTRNVIPQQPRHNVATTRTTTSRLFSYLDSLDSKELADADAAMKAMPAEERKEKIGKMIADDEWLGLAVEMTEAVRAAVVQDVKKKQKAVADGVKGKTTEFIGKDQYKVGDIAKTLDAKVKQEVANLRGKDDYELGDLTIALDKASKDMACKLTGKDDYEAGDLAIHVDGEIKKIVADYCGKDEYEVGDLTKEITARVTTRVLTFTGKDDYSFGDIVKEVNGRRQAWAKDFLGEEAWENYEFGDIATKAMKDFKKGYKFGDISKKVAGKVAKAVEDANPSLSP
mmetsp:Transcript_12056/g.26106  ORF Transcript_12056/g.26106 Transcript_12056/m.26106 type:complete len:315 (+) Transcript_12056:83-1027(+)|eukprot:CAMPEP_0178525558 /NCGR_PEP_ID=MMETSP0696-20121128/30246_1 /TAXON_ID=265572 /ORGANISM="Extubocellulus spinifer, Strain CCMP396" /LENGTH=314 /DNA_ID=CAMNT_0020156979 /DNA_START=13 /DNA_END=957 /DNA_ORIENTATION=+